MSERQLKRYLTIIGIIFLLVIPLFISSPYFLHIFIMTFWFAYLAICWNWVGGFTGQFSLAHGTLIGIGAYTSSILFINLHLTPFIGMLAGGIVAVVFSIPFSYPCFSLRGIYFALATVAVAASVQIYVMSTYKIGKINIGGADGLSIPPTDSILFFQSTSKIPYYYIIIGLFLLVVFLSFKIKNSKLGFYLRAISENQESAESLGISSRKYKLIIFMLSAFFTAIGGTFYAQLMLVIDPARIMGIDISIELALMSILGGMNYILGPFLGAVIIVPVSEYFRVWLGSRYAGAHLIIYGLMLMIMIIYFPHGINRYINSWLRTLKEKWIKSEERS